jgi:hypothetical protein
MKMKFKPGTWVHVNVEEDFPISNRAAGGSIFHPFVLSYSIVMRAGKRLGQIEGSTHGEFQGYYSVKFPITDGFFARGDTPEELCTPIKKTPEEFCKPVKKKKTT